MSAKRPVIHGEVLTKHWVVDLILDMAGYRSEFDLADRLAVEPSFGRGGFLFPMVERLLESARLHDRPLEDCQRSIVAIDLQESNARNVETLLHHNLCWSGVNPKVASKLTRSWIACDDYLLTERGSSADFVIGNPPYIRYDDLEVELVNAYRERWPTMSGRSDLYIGFIERGLRSLKTDGALAYICADRWMRNQYGKNLRRLIEDEFSVSAVLSMHDVDAFEERVSAYPAITVIRNTPQAGAIAATASAAFDESSVLDFQTWFTDGRSAPHSDARFKAAELPHWFSGGGLWPAGEPEQLAMLEDLNDRFDPLQDEATGTKVGIGIATGNDKVYVTTDGDAVEPDRMLPLVVRRDTNSGTVEWHDNYLINPWDSDGSLVDLNEHPKLAAFFAQHEESLRGRHIGKKNPKNWYRTIDKVDTRLIGRPKLLFPDMARRANPTLDEGDLYPHHNLYWVTSDKWDLRVLGGLLLSKVTDAFIGAYCVRMRGGTMRFQAQYLRQIRVPPMDSISAPVASELADAFERRDINRATDLAAAVYGIEHYRDLLERIQ